VHSQTKQQHGTLIEEKSGVVPHEARSSRSISITVDADETPSKEAKIDECIELNLQEFHSSSDSAVPGSVELLLKITCDNTADALPVQWSDNFERLRDLE